MEKMFRKNATMDRKNPIMNRKTMGLAAVMLCTVSVTGCTAITESDQAKTAKILGIKLPDAEQCEYMDTHGGLLGDGDTMAKITFSQKEAAALEAELAGNEKWNELPVTDSLALMLYGGTADDVSYRGRLWIMDQYLGDGTTEQIQSVSEGYWYFLDKNDEENRYGQWEEETIKIPDMPEIVSHAYEFTQNYVIAVYDAENGILYVHEYDS